MDDVSNVEIKRQAECQDSVGMPGLPRGESHKVIVRFLKHMQNMVWLSCRGGGPRPLLAISTNEHKVHEMIAGWVSRCRR